MQNSDIPKSKSEIGRREFLALAAQGIVVAGSLPFLARGAQATAAANAGSLPADLPKAITLPRLAAKSEKESELMPTRLGDSERIGIALVGLGRLSLEQILPAFAHSKRAKITALVSGDAAKAKRVGQMYGVPEGSQYSYADFDKIRDNSQVQAVYIVLPNSMHAEYTVRAAKAGKHVLCEKPMANSVTEAEQMVQACKQAQRQLMIAYRIQYEPHHRLIMNWVRGHKELGQVRLMELQNVQAQSETNLAQWRLKKALAGGGALPDIGLYCLNTARFLTGEEPIEISARLHSLPSDARFKEVEEEVAFTLRFPSGVTASCLCSYSCHSGKRYRVMGTQAWAEMDPAFSYTGLKMRRSRLMPAPGGPALDVLENITLEQKNQFALELDHFAECVAKNQQPFTPGEEGLQDMKLMAAIYESARKGTVVTLDKISKPDAFRGPPPTPEQG